MFPSNMLSGRFTHYHGETCLFENDNLETLITHVVAWIRENPSRSNYHTGHTHYVGMVYHAPNNSIKVKATGENIATIQWGCPRYETLRIVRKGIVSRRFTDGYEIVIR